MSFNSINKFQNYTQTILNSIKRRTGIEDRHFPDISKKIFKTFIFLGCALIPFLIIIYYGLTNPAKINNTNYMPSIAFFIPLGLIFYYFNQNELSLIPQKQFFTLSILLFIIALGLHWASNISPSTLSSLATATQVLTIGIVIVGLAILYLLTFDYLKKQSGILGLVFNFIFYIPCLLIEGFQYFKREFQTTPSTLFILFIIELLLIIVYFKFDEWLTAMTKTNKNCILPNPLPLNVSQTIANTNMLTYNQENQTRIENDDQSYKNNNYAISFWVYVNTDNVNNEYKILSLGKDRPKFCYNPSKNEFIVYFTDVNKDAKHTLQFTPQKWVYVAINYYNNRADLFIDGLFEYSFKFDSSSFPSKLDKTSTIEVGETNSLLNGSITSVYYYKDEILTEFKLSRIYNMYKLKNPP